MGYQVNTAFIEWLSKVVIKPQYIDSCQVSQFSELCWAICLTFFKLTFLYWSSVILQLCSLFFFDYFFLFPVISQFSFLFGFHLIIYVFMYLFIYLWSSLQTLSLFPLPRFLQDSFLKFLTQYITYSQSRPIARQKTAICYNPQAFMSWRLPTVPFPLLLFLLPLAHILHQ